MGMVFNSITKYKEAIKCYDVALKITPNNTTAWINKDLALLSLGKYTDAMDCCEEALRMDRRDLESCKT